MDEYQENILLTEEDLDNIKKILKELNFKDFKIHPHYWFNKIPGVPRHGFQIKELEKLFNNIDLITHGFKRKSNKSFAYTLIYKLSTNRFLKVCYFFDEEPKKIFNAIPISRNLDKAVLRKYGVRL